MIEMRYGKKGLTLDLPSGMDITLIQKRRMRVLEDPRGAAMAAFDLPQGSGTLSEEAEGAPECLHSRVRRHETGSERPYSAGPCQDPPERGSSCGQHNHPCRDGASPPERRRRAPGADRRRMGFEQGESLQPFRPERRRPRGPGEDSRRFAGEARQALRGGRSEDRRRSCRTPFHGRVFRWKKGNCSGRSPSGIRSAPSIPRGA